jgi:hypothetical protein
MHRLGCFDQLTIRLACFASSTGVATLQALDPLLSSQPATDGGAMAASHGRALMDLMESAEVCFGFKVTLRLGCFASRVKDSSRIFASSASFASFQTSCMWLGSGAPSRRILSVDYHSCLSNASLSLRFATLIAARRCPLLPITA